MTIEMTNRYPRFRLRGDAMTKASFDEIHAAVRDQYAEAARVATGCSSCGSVGAAEGLIGRSLYELSDAESLPSAALAASLGCGNPTMLAELRQGDVVLDLGSGGGIDVLLSARRVGPTGKAYGLDMTPEMLDLANKNRAEAGVTNVEFMLGTIENIPLPDATVDVVISNCVVNLSPDKDAVLREAFRVLKPGGRLAISDIVLRRPLSEPTSRLMGLWTGCIAGALDAADYESKLAAAGFEQVSIEPTHVFERDDVVSMAGDLAIEVPPGLDPASVVDELGGAIMSAFVRGQRPA
jgi:arsenite methyltransferase